MMYGVVILHEVSLLNYKKTAYTGVNRIVASVINNWNDSSNSFYELINSYTYFCMVNMIF